MYFKRAGVLTLRDHLSATILETSDQKHNTPVIYHPPSAPPFNLQSATHRIGRYYLHSYVEFTSLSKLTESKSTATL